MVGASTKTWKLLVVNTPESQKGFDWRLGLEPHRHKAPPPQPRNKILAFTDEEVRSMYRQVIVVHFLTMPPDPSLKNFQYAQLSVEEKAKYDEEARKVEAEHLQTAAAVSAQEMNGCQNPKRMAPDEKDGRPRRVAHPGYATQLQSTT